MKHLLAILTVALAGAAVTASAGVPYTDASFLADDTYTERFDKLVDATLTNGKNGVYDYGSYVVTFENSSRLKIHANENINLYVYDVVDNVQSGNNVSALKGTAPNPVQQIGYRELGTQDGTIHALGDPTDTEVLQRYYVNNPQPYEVVRNSYYLGEFEAGKDYELYVSYAADGSGGQWSYTDTAGGYLAQKDALMSVYLSKNFNNTYNVKADEYIALAQVNNKSFGLRAAPAAGGGGTVGAPLPGGAALYVIAGLFALGFIVVRRRKEVAA